jgi:hypothetical protein
MAVRLRSARGARAPESAAAKADEAGGMCGRTAAETHGCALLGGSSRRVNMRRVASVKPNHFRMARRLRRRSNEAVQVQACACRRAAPISKRMPVSCNRGLDGRAEGVERGPGSVEDGRGAWEPADRGIPGGRTRANADAPDEKRDAATATESCRTPDTRPARGLALRGRAEQRYRETPDDGS